MKGFELVGIAHGVAAALVLAQGCENSCEELGNCAEYRGDGGASSAGMSEPDGAAGETGEGGTRGGADFAGQTGGGAAGMPSSGEAGERSEGGAGGAATGCEDEHGARLEGTSNEACGANGERCAICAEGQECTSGECRCSVISCPEGCCDGTVCIDYSEQSAATCGGAGAACDSCSAGQTCDSAGTCACTLDSCDGWCNDTTCVPFEVIAADQPTFPKSRGIALLGSTVYWVSSSSSDARASSYRLQRRVAGNGAVTLLSNQPPALDSIVIGDERVYTLDSYNRVIRSTRLNGSDLRTDQSYAASLRFRNHRIYFHQNSYGGVSINSQSEATSTEIRTEYQWYLPSVVLQVYPEVADIAFDYAGNIVYGFNSDITNTQTFAYTINLLNGSGITKLFGAAVDRMVRLETDRFGRYYWLHRASDGATALAAARDGETTWITISRNVDVSDFAVAELVSGHAFVYYAYWDATRSVFGLSLYDMASGTNYELLVDRMLGSLVADDVSLYFFEGSGHRLVRLPLPHLALGL